MVGLAEVACTSRAAGIFYSLVGQFARVPVPWGVSGLRVAAVAFVQSLRRKRKRMAIEDRRFFAGAHWTGKKVKLESLIMAQIERWRHA